MAKYLVIVDEDKRCFNVSDCSEEGGDFLNSFYMARAKGRRVRYFESEDSESAHAVADRYIAEAGGEYAHTPQRILVAVADCVAASPRDDEGPAGT